MTDPLITGQRQNDLGQPIGLPVSFGAPCRTPDERDLKGRYCTLERLDARHADGLHAAFCEDTDGRIWTYLPEGPFATSDAYRAWVDKNAPVTDPILYAILVNGAPLGHASYLRIAPEPRSIEVGWINLSPRLQRTRAATEFQFLMMAHAFDDLGYRRYEWKCDALNAGSRDAARRLGFTYEGTFRQATHYKGRNRDTAWFSILDSEWPALKSRFERWLDPGNFTPDGQQRARLNAV